MKRLPDLLRLRSNAELWELGFLAVAFYVALRVTLSHLLGASPGCIFGDGCNKVLTSSLSSIGGVPLAALGLAGVSVAFLHAATGAFVSEIGALAHCWLIRVMGTTAVALQIWAAAALHSFCGLCFLFCISMLGTLLASEVRMRLPRRPAPRVAVAMSVILAGLMSLHLVVFPVELPGPRLRTLKPLQSLGRAFFDPDGGIVVGPPHGRAVISFVDPQCMHCKDELPGLIAEAKSERNCCLEVRWYPQSAIGRRVSAVALATSRRESAADVLLAILDHDVETENDVTDLEKDLRAAREVTVGVLNPRNSWILLVNQDLRCAKELGVSGTPAYIGCTRDDQFVELTYAQAQAWLRG